VRSLLNRRRAHSSYDPQFTKNKLQSIKGDSSLLDFQLQLNSVARAKGARVSVRIKVKSNINDSRASNVYYFIQRSEHASFPSPVTELTG